MSARSPLWEAPVSTRDGSQLCLACGLCCTGFLHPNAILQIDETQQADELGLTWYAQETGLVFDLPCPCFREGRCSVYPNRPKVCGEYRCRLLRKYLSGAIELDVGLAVVREAKKRIDALRRLMGTEDSSKRLWEQVSEFLKRGAASSGSEAERRAHAEFLLELLALRTHRRRFEAPNPSDARPGPSQRDLPGGAAGR
jgi:Fe-S-cluster containining protein